MSYGPDNAQRAQMLGQRNIAAVTELMAAFQTFNLRCTQLAQSGEPEAALDHCEKGIARIEGFAMTIRRMTEEV